MVLPTSSQQNRTWSKKNSFDWQSPGSTRRTLKRTSEQLSNEPSSKVLAFTAARLYLDPALVKQARAEFEKARGADFVYQPMVGDRKPPLDYRD